MLDLEASDPAAVGPYALRARLGEGGMGRVYLAYSPSGRLLAVKLIRAELAGDATFRDRFRREVAAARLVSGAFTAPVVDADPNAPVPWLATQYVAGPSLHEAVAQAGPFAEPVLRRLAAGILEAIIAVHRVGIVHRDLKPSNVLLAADGPRLIDFGIARATDHTELTRSGDIVGTAAYMSPEQAGGLEAGPAADVFAAAAVLVFAATGRGPFGRGAPAAVLFRVVHGEPDLTGVPPSLHDTLRSCLAKDPANRPGPEALLGWFADGVQVAGPTWPSAVTRLLDQRAAELATPASPRSATPAAPPTPSPFPAPTPSPFPGPSPSPFPGPSPSQPSVPAPGPTPPAPEDAPPTRLTPPGRTAPPRPPLAPTRVAPPTWAPQPTPARGPALGTDPSTPASDLPAPPQTPPKTPPPDPPPPTPPPQTPPPFAPEWTPDPAAGSPVGAPRPTAPGPVVFPGRWRWFLATGGALLAVVLVLAFAAAGLISDAVSADATMAPSSRLNRCFWAGGLLVVALYLLPAARWRLRYARRRPALSISPHGLHAEVGGVSYDIGWPYVARADVICIGRHQALAVWPATPGTTWVASYGRRARRRPRGRYRAGWHNSLLGCDVLLDIGLLRGHPAREVATALGAVPRPSPTVPPPGDYARPPHTFGRGGRW